MGRKPKDNKLNLVEVHARLFSDDVATIKQIAEQKRLPWQIELRQLVHRALTGEKRDLVILKE